MKPKVLCAFCWLARLLRKLVYFVDKQAHSEEAYILQEQEKATIVLFKRIQTGEFREEKNVRTKVTEANSYVGAINLSLINATFKRKH